jgi:ubiquinone/menaquinone biosynthesis C-methylase UbiE
MSENNNLFYKILTNTYIYICFQRLMSATYVRKKFVKNHIKKGYNVLDVGCGPSSILNDLPKINYYGYDINSSYIKYAKKKISKQELSFFL